MGTRVVERFRGVLTGPGLASQPVSSSRLYCSPAVIAGLGFHAKALGRILGQCSPTVSISIFASYGLRAMAEMSGTSIEEVTRKSRYYFLSQGWQETPCRLALL